jgi:hypothetical protein
LAQANPHCSEKNFRLALGTQKFVQNLEFRWQNEPRVIFKDENLSFLEADGPGNLASANAKRKKGSPFARNDNQVWTLGCSLDDSGTG